MENGELGEIGFARAYCLSEEPLDIALMVASSGISQRTQAGETMY